MKNLVEHWVHALRAESHLWQFGSWNATVQLPALML
jgi:hypothetical protein